MSSNVIHKGSFSNMNVLITIANVIPNMTLLIYENLQEGQITKSPWAKKNEIKFEADYKNIEYKNSKEGLNVYSPNGDSGW